MGLTTAKSALRCPPGMGTLRTPIALKSAVAFLSRPPVEPLNAERGMWALKEGGVALDLLASTPIRDRHLPPSKESRERPPLELPRGAGP